MTDRYTIPCYPTWICPECSTYLNNAESPVDMTEEAEQAWWEAYVIGTANYLIIAGTLPEYHDMKFCTAYDADGEVTGESCDCDRENHKEITCAICRRHHIGEAFRVTFWKDSEDTPEPTRTDIMVPCWTCHKWTLVAMVNVDTLECKECEDTNATAGV